jgi:hypothetical protein
MKVITGLGILIMILAALSMSYVDLVYAQPLCYGLEATIIGTPDDDVIDGTSDPDVIVGLAGNDEINGLEGDDVICGGRGNDLIRGGDGNDYLFGGLGADILRGNADDDTLRGGRGNDVNNGGPGNDDCSDGLGKNTFVSCEAESQCPCDFFSVPMTEGCWQRNTGQPPRFFDIPLCNSCTNEFGKCDLKMIGLDDDRDGIGVWIIDDRYEGIQRSCHIIGLKSDICSAPEISYGISEKTVDDCLADIEAYAADLNEAGIRVFGGPPYICLPN